VNHVLKLVNLLPRRNFIDTGWGMAAVRLSYS